MSDVFEVNLVSAFNLCQRLSIEVVMIKGQASFLLNKTTALLPARQLGDEIIGRSEFNI